MQPLRVYLTLKQFPVNHFPVVADLLADQVPGIAHYGFGGLVGAVYVGHVVSGKQVAVPVHPVPEYVQRVVARYWLAGRGPPDRVSDVALR